MDSIENQAKVKKIGKKIAIAEEMRYTTGNSSRKLRMITQQIRTNAMVSYFFLGWTFLLGKNNPNFADPFIQAHAKNATKIQLAFLGIFVAYSYFIASYFKEVPLRPLPFSLDRVVTAGLFLWGIAAIIIGAMAAMK